MASYLARDYDRDALPAIRRSGILDGTTLTGTRRLETVNDDTYRYRSTSPTGYHRADSPLFQPRPPSPTASRRVASEMQDQVRGFKEELRKKDALIQQLVSMEAVPKQATIPARPIADHVRVDTLYMGDRHAVEQARSEVAGLQVKNDKMQSHIRELEAQLDAKDIKIKEMETILQTCRENENRLTTLIDSMRQQMAEIEGRAGSYENVASRSELTVNTLQREVREKTERITELESRLKKHLGDREEAESKCNIVEKKYHDMLFQFSSMLKADDLGGSPGTVEDIVRKMTDLIQDNALLKGKIVTMNEHVQSTELETKASRETIMRLVSEVGKEQKVASRYTTDLDTLRMPGLAPDRLYLGPSKRGRAYHDERDHELEARRSLERELVLMKESLDASQRQLDAARNELSMRDGRLSELDNEMRTNSYDVRSVQGQYGEFREQLASLLSTIDERIHPREDEIKTKVKYMTQDNREMAIKIESLEDRVKTVTEQLETQYELHKTAASRARKAEVDVAELEQRYHHVEGELAAGDVLRDGFMSDKEKYLRCMQRLGEAMRMDRISLDLGLDMTLDALIARAEQLVRLEADALANKSTHVYNLQRKVKSFKEQLESKELHADLLRKKITQLEEKLLGKTEVQRERDSESFRVRKLEKLIEKYKMNLQDSRQEATNLKAQLLGSSELRLRTMEQRKEIEELVSQVEDLERTRKKQASKIGSLRENLENQGHSLQEKSVVSDNAVHALSSELKTTKNALDAISHREKQLLDFRNVVARMLGLDLNTLAIPDYEIISRLEKLIQAHHSHAFTTMSMEEALADMEDGFRSGYEDYARHMSSEEPTTIRRSRDRAKRKAARARARSMSPTRRDPRSY